MLQDINCCPGYIYFIKKLLYSCCWRDSTAGKMALHMAGPDAIPNILYSSLSTPVSFVSGKLEQQCVCAQ